MNLAKPLYCEADSTIIFYEDEYPWNGLPQAYSVRAGDHFIIKDGDVVLAAIPAES